MARLPSVFLPPLALEGLGKGRLAGKKPAGLVYEFHRHGPLDALLERHPFSITAVCPPLHSL